ncbi:MAG: hypothetical protein QOF90_3075 [Acetobacteraceae bacterium]|jgi:hypothetical protein|nr:hypothetical protein [Acetobacteraceae bacterium]
MLAALVPRVGFGVRVAGRGIPGLTVRDLAQQVVDTW